MLRITNIQAGPRGINAASGTVVLRPGEARDDLDVPEAELAVARRTGWFAFGEPADDQPAAEPKEDPGKKTKKG